MKKLICLLVSLLLALSLTACVDKNEGGNEDVESGLGNGITWGEDGIETPLLPG